MTADIKSETDSSSGRADSISNGTTPGLTVGAIAGIVVAAVVVVAAIAIFIGIKVSQRQIQTPSSADGYTQM